MKKSMKKMIFLIFVVITFFGSSIAFVVVNLGGVPQQQEKLEPLKSFVIEGDIDPRLEQAYLSNGFTFLKYYYAEKDAVLEQYIDALPDLTITNFNQKQLYVQKISSNNNRIIIRGPSGEALLTSGNITEIAIYQTLCSTLLFAPPECALNITA